MSWEESNQKESCNKMEYNKKKTMNQKTKYFKNRKERRSNSNTTLHKTETNFPSLSLGQSITKELDPPVSSVLNFSFLSKGEEETTTVKEDNLPEGWVRLTSKHKKKNKLSEIANNEPLQSQDTSDETINYSELKKLVSNWQSYRDMMNDHLDQSSPFWDCKNLHDELSDTDLESEESEEEEYEDMFNEENSEGDY
jgi:hypothetical protein